MAHRSLTTLALTALVLTQANIAVANTLASDTDKISYAIGVDLGKKFKEQDIQVKPETLMQGFKDAQAGSKLLMTDKELADTFTAFQKSMMEKRIAQFQKASTVHTQAGKEYLEKNKAQPGVKTTTSGLQYKVVKPGKGSNPKVTDTVTVEYTGKTLDGKVFDSTDKVGKPAEFKVNQVIPGWQEALQLMQPGAVYEVAIPAELAYGTRGAGQMIGPNETLLFNIHLLSVSAK